MINDKGRRVIDYVSNREKTRLMMNNDEPHHHSEIDRNELSRVRIVFVLSFFIRTEVVSSIEQRMSRLLCLRNAIVSFCS